MGRSRSKQSGLPRLSQSVVVDPASDLQHTKEHLAAKGGIAPKEQRLFFSVSPERVKETADSAVDLSICRGLKKAVWQAVVFKNDRSVAHLINPTVDTEDLPHRDPVCQTSGQAFILSCVFSTCKPAAKGSGVEARELCLPVDEKGVYRVNLFLRTERGTAAWPVQYNFLGEKIFIEARCKAQLDIRSQAHHALQQQQYAASGVPGDRLPDLTVLGLIKVSPDDYITVVCRQAEGQVNLEAITLRAAVCDLDKGVWDSVRDMASTWCSENRLAILQGRANTSKSVAPSDCHVFHQRHNADKRVLGGSGMKRPVSAKRTETPYGSLLESTLSAETVAPIADGHEDDLMTFEEKRRLKELGRPPACCAEPDIRSVGAAAEQTTGAHKELDTGQNAREGYDGEVADSSSDSGCDVPTTPDVLSESPCTMDRGRDQSDSGSSSLDCQAIDERWDTGRVPHERQRTPSRSFTPSGVGSRRKDKLQDFAVLQEKQPMEDPDSVLPSGKPSIEDELRSSDGSSSGPSSSRAFPGSSRRQPRPRTRDGSMGFAGPSPAPPYVARYQNPRDMWQPRLPIPVFGPPSQGHWSPGFQMQYYPQPYFQHPGLVGGYYWDRPVIFMAAPREHAVPMVPNHVLWAPPAVSESCLDRAEHAVRTVTARPGTPGSKADGRRPFLSHRKPPPIRNGGSQHSIDLGSNLQVPKGFDVEGRASQVGSSAAVSVDQQHRTLEAASGFPASDVMAAPDQVVNTLSVPGCVPALSQAAAPVPPPCSHAESECALDRFMLNVCRGIEGSTSDGVKGTLVSDIWNAFKDASVFGLEVYTERGPRAPTSAIYIPILSGCRLFVSKHQQGVDVPLSDKKMYTVDCPSGPDTVCAIFEHTEGGHARSRQPFFEAMHNLLKGDASAALLNLNVEKLHPASWFAIRWHPLYRIPEAPLHAEFLTFHSFQPVPLAETYFGAMKPSPITSESRCQGSGPHVLPIIAMRATIPKEEGWLEPHLQSQTMKDPAACESHLSRLDKLRKLGLETHAATLAYSGGVHPVGKEKSIFQFADLGAEKGVFEHIRCI
eukprot:jgi/Botrbrau1/23177/Bobra.0041s0028.1